jgi:glycosyltransferase involved in cell wall biosynthesis
LAPSKLLIDGSMQSMKVGVVIPVFNRLSRLRRAIDSVLAQADVEFELVVVDDASTRDLAEMRAVISGSGHGWISHAINQGPAAARNAGEIALSPEVKWVAFLDSDDEWLPNKLSRQVQWTKQNPQLRIFQCREQWIRNDQPAKRPRHLMEPEGEIFSDCVARCCISPSAVMLRRDLFDEVGGFDERYRVCEDYQLWLRIARGEAVGLLDEVLAIKYGGAEDQLTAMVPAFDRWRLRALLEIFPSAGDRQDLVLSGIAEKARILERGAAKQGRAEALELYAKIRGWAESPDAKKVSESAVLSSQLESLLSDGAS